MGIFDFVQDYRVITDWLNANQGVVGVGLFVITALLGWTTGIFQALRRRPLFKVRLIDGPTLVCTYGVAQNYEQYQVHRTGIALYLDIVNVGSAPSSIMSIRVAYHWALLPFSKLWFKYCIGWFWLEHQAVCLEDFQVAIGENTKFYPFLTQRSSTSGRSADTFLEVGKSTIGVVYFEQTDSWGGCFPVAFQGKVRIKLRVEDAFGRWHTKKFCVPKVTFAEAQKYNPSFGQTLSALNGEEAPFELDVDQYGNIIPPESAGPKTTPISKSDAAN